MLKIRLQRTGRKHQPTYRLVLADSKSSAKSGKYLELLGNYDSRHGEKATIKTDRVLHWLSVGSQISPTVHNLLVDRKIIIGKKINKLPLKKPVKKEVATPTAAPAVSTEVSEVAESTVSEIVPETSAPAESTEALV